MIAAAESREPERPGGGQPESAGDVVYVLQLPVLQVVLNPRPQENGGCGRGGAEVHRCECNGCGRCFTDRPGFLGLHFDDWIVLKALRLVARKHSVETASQAQWDDDRVKVSGCNIQRWMDKYPKMVEAFARRLKMQAGDAATADEKHFKSKGKGRRFYTRCLNTKFVPSGETAADKLNYKAGRLFSDMPERLGRRPRFMLSDRLGGFT